MGNTKLKKPKFVNKPKCVDLTMKSNKIISPHNSKEHKIFIGDSINVLDKIQDKSCKLVFADPPYNMGKNFGNNKDKWPTGEEYKTWCKSWIDKCVEKLTDDGSIMIMGHPRYSSYLVPYLDKKLNYVNQIIYYYTDGMPEKKNFEKRYEVILYYRKNESNYTFNIDDVRVPLVRYDKKSKVEGKNPNDVWQIHRVRWNSKERISLDNGKIAHLTQKPIRLMRRIILSTTDKNDIILDPFLGTGTTSIASKELGRKSYGIEINPDYVKIAKNRLKNTKPIIGDIKFDSR